VSGSDFKKRFETAILSVLIALNGYFVKRLVDEIDNTKQVGIQTQMQVAEARVEISNIKTILTRVRMRDARCDAPRMRIYPSMLELEPGGSNGNKAFLPIKNFLVASPRIGCGIGAGFGSFYPSKLYGSRSGVGSY